MYGRRHRRVRTVAGENPEQREALRAALLGEDADLHAALARLALAQERTEARVEALAERVGELAAAQERTQGPLESTDARLYTVLYR